MMSKKNITMVLLWFASYWTAAQEPIIIHNHINNSSSNSTGINEGFACHSLWNKELKECVLCFSHKPRITLLKKLDPARRKSFMLHLSFDEYQRFVEQFSEQEWQDLYASLSNEEKERWPTSVAYQTEALKTMVTSGDRTSAAAELGLALVDSTVPGLRAIRLSVQALYLFHAGRLPTTTMMLDKSFQAFKERHFA